jgi:hypothetical protein
MSVSPGNSDGRARMPADVAECLHMTVIGRHLKMMGAHGPGKNGVP